MYLRNDEVAQKTRRENQEMAMTREEIRSILSAMSREEMENAIERQMLRFPSQTSRLRARTGDFDAMEEVVVDYFVVCGMGLVSLEDCASWTMDFLNSEVRASMRCGAFEAVSRIAIEVIDYAKRDGLNGKLLDTDITRTCCEILRDCATARPELTAQIRRELKKAADPENQEIHQLLRELSREPTREEKLRSLMKRLDREIEEKNSESKDLTVMFEGKRVGSPELRLYCMRELGASEEEVEEYCFTHRRFTGLRRRCLADAQQNHDTDRLILLLREQLDLEDGSPAARHGTALRLAKLYREVGKRTEERALRMDEFARSGGGSEDVRRIRELCDEEHWPEVRKELISRAPDDEARAAVCAAGGLQEELWKLMEKKSELLDLYAAQLPAERAPEVLALCRKRAQELARTADRPADCRRLIACLRQMLALPEGRELVTTLADRWARKWPKRRAMHSEIRRLLKEQKNGKKA